jgi:hypothetical protein
MIREVLLAGPPSFDVFCPGCGTSSAIFGLLIATRAHRSARWC